MFPHTPLGHLVSGCYVKHLGLGLTATAGCSPHPPTCSFQTWEVFLRSRDSSDNSTGSFFFPLVTLCRRAKLADWRRVGGFCESERLISSAICWAENFFGTRELRKPEPATLLNSWFAGFPLDLLVLPLHQPHTIQNILRKHKCKELKNIQSWVIQLAPAFPRPPSSPTRAEHYCRAGFWFDCI